MDQFDASVLITNYNNLKLRRTVSLTVNLCVGLDLVDAIRKLLLDNYSLEDFETWKITSLIRIPTTLNQTSHTTYKTTCEACRVGEMNQEGHMEYGGCLYEGPTFD
jgi:hypothetical protein